MAQNESRPRRLSISSLDHGPQQPTSLAIVERLDMKGPQRCYIRWVAGRAFLEFLSTFCGILHVTYTRLFLCSCEIEFLLTVSVQLMEILDTESNSAIIAWYVCLFIASASNSFSLWRCTHGVPNMLLTGDPVTMYLHVNFKPGFHTEGVL